MSLHKACILGELAKFLESVLGALSVPSQIVISPYLLEEFPLMGMITDSVVVCPESEPDRVRQLYEVVEEDRMIITIPDTDNEGCIQILHQRAAFLGAGVRERHYSQRDCHRITYLRID